MTTRVSLASLLLGMLLAAGCGGPKQLPPPRQGANGNAAPAAQPGNPPAPAPVAVKPAAEPIAAAPAEELPPPGPDDFVIDQAQTVTEIGGDYQPPPIEPVEVVALPGGFDSTTLEIVESDGESATANSNRPPTTPIPVTPGTSPNPATDDESGEWALPEDAKILDQYGVDPDTGLPNRIQLPTDTVEMVLIPPGVFLEGVDGRDENASPQHPVLLENPYYIDVVEVTVARYDAFREALRKGEGRKMDQPLNHDDNPQQPAVGIKFLDAKFYARWAGKELPTEAQWERAARGSAGFDYPWGNGRPIFHQPRSPGQIDPVATFPGDVSPHGVFDMAGNAREWTLDLYSADTYQKQTAQGSGPVRNPTGPKVPPSVKLQVIKGGKTDWHVWQRAGAAQTEIAADLGFRCVLNISTTASQKDSKKGTPKGKNERSPASRPDKMSKKVGL